MGAASAATVRGNSRLKPLPQSGKESANYPPKRRRGASRLALNPRRRYNFRPIRSPPRYRCSLPTCALPATTRSWPAPWPTKLRRQEDHVELIASENYASPRVLEAQGSVLTNKYAEGYPASATTAVASTWTSPRNWRSNGSSSFSMPTTPTCSRIRARRPTRRCTCRCCRPATASSACRSRTAATLPTAPRSTSAASCSTRRSTASTPTA